MKYPTHKLTIGYLVPKYSSALTGTYKITYEKWLSGEVKCARDEKNIYLHSLLILVKIFVIGLDIGMLEMQGTLGNVV